MHFEWLVNVEQGTKNIKWPEQKTQKTPKNEIKLAKKIKKEYFNEKAKK